MNTIQQYGIGIAALIIGLFGGYAYGVASVPPMDHSSMTGAMNSMTEALEGKVGDEFDRVFLSEMIVHHEGAVAMAESALSSAKHQEIKDLAQAIISAQNKEIADMKAWLGTWYGQ